MFWIAIRYDLKTLSKITILRNNSRTTNVRGIEKRKCEWSIEFLLIQIENINKRQTMNAIIVGSIFFVLQLSLVIIDKIKFKYKTRWFQSDDIVKSEI